MEKLFSYGTLREKSVQLALFERELEGEPDVLTGYRLVALEITDARSVAISGTATDRPPLSGPVAMLV